MSLTKNISSLTDTKKQIQGVQGVSGEAMGVSQSSLKIIDETISLLQSVQSTLTPLTGKTLSQLEKYINNATSLNEEIINNIGLSVDNISKTIVSNITTSICHKQSIVNDVASLQKIRRSLYNKISQLQSKISKISADIRKIENINTNPFTNDPLPEPLVPKKLTEALQTLEGEILSHEFAMSDIRSLMNNINQLLVLLSGIIQELTNIQNVLEIIHSDIVQALSDINAQKVTSIPVFIKTAIKEINNIVSEIT